MLVRFLVVASAFLAATAQAPRGDALKPPDRFTVNSDGHPMAVWGRRPASPKGAILLVHGRTWSSRPDFDLQVPGLQRSVLTSFAAQGFAAYAVDLRGYGETPRDGTGWLTPRRSVQDIVNVLTWVVAQHPSLPKPTLVGWSRGAIMSGMAAQSASGKVSNLVMFGFAYDPDLQFQELDPGEKPLKIKNSEADAESDFISPGVTPKVVVASFVAQALKSDPILVDAKDDADFNGFQPRTLATPTLVLFGSDDPGLNQGEAGIMFAALGSRDKQMVVLPGADHAAQLEDTHDAWIAAIVNFINRPLPRR